jgi:hypothetical protein
MSLYEQLTPERKLRLKNEARRFPMMIRDLTEHLEDVDVALDLPDIYLYIIYDIFIIKGDDLYDIFNK